MNQELEDLKKHSVRLDDIEYAFYKHPTSFESFFMNHPLPAWVKSVCGKMVLSNTAYETSYDIPPIQYANSFDKDHWPTEQAESFGKLDKRAADANDLVIGVEWVTLPAYGNRRQALVVSKWPVKWTEDGKPSHIAGLVLGSVTFKPLGV